MKRSVATQVGDRIRALRLQAHGGRLTQERLAERADISVSFLSMIERGERTAHVDTLSQIAGALEVPIDELFRERSQPPEIGDATLKPLTEFVKRQALTHQEIGRLLTVAQALFGRQ